MRSEFLAFILLLFAWVGSADLIAQSIDPENIKTAPAPELKHVCILESTHLNTKHFVRHEDITGKQRSRQASSAFEVSYENSCGGKQWPQEAVAAFEYAMNIWETHLQSSIPIQIEATWRELDADVLGNAGPTIVAQVESPPGVENTWYAVAQASAMSGFDIKEEVSNTDYDITMNINCEFDDWYFGTDANTPLGLIDFVTVVLHEIGHGVGFLGSVTADENIKVAEWGFGDDTLPIIYDQFAEDGNANHILNELIYENPSSELYEAVTGQNEGLYFSGSESNRVFGDNPVPLYAPVPWQGGSSYSHLDQQTFNGTDNTLMQPRINRQSANHSPGPVVCAMLQDQGWPLGASCLALLGVEAILTIDQGVLDIGINFGVTNENSIENQTLTISNDISSEDPLSGQLAIENSDFSVEPTNESFMLEPGESLDIDIQFRPRRPGIKEANLVLFHNSANQPNPLQITLKGEALPENDIFILDQNYPNPFNNLTTIEYAISQTANIELSVYNSGGQLIETLVNEQQDENRYKIEFDARSLASGMYLYRIVVDNETDLRKLLLVK